uniref:Uncharacterized protein n=1 Tax=Anopheles quadriannulatus TaxID=34691 RepID=A0A182XU58_ANOQN
TCSVSRSLCPNPRRLLRIKTELYQRAKTFAEVTAARSSSVRPVLLSASWELGSSSHGGG